MKYQVNLHLIKQQRLELHLSLGDMTEALGLQSADQYLRRETGEYNFKATELPVLSRVLKIPLEHLYTQNVVKIAKGD
ncbi:helix-turn-helix domain-containing protein [Schleiferilactobacillus shenzhenensis]|uniref:helix-turn-helix domain-containing protein n=1 Tax=Schleiferilactobacillus shenzhenensis TaxID=1231337 RepID=UPI000412E6BD|nr:helix-turn-helix transcriptional regulator [Schleiferilactobacillus shenzhenensis]